MKDNRGFTLIELLAVIVILSSISLIVVASISASLENRDDKECIEQIELAKNAAKIYFSLQDNVDSVSIATLKSENYFSNNNKVNRLNENTTITFGNSGYQYNGECN